MGSSIVDVKANEPNDGSMASLMGAGWTNLTGQQPGSKSLIRKLLLLIY